MATNQALFLVSYLGIQQSRLDHLRENALLAYAVRFLFAAAWRTGWRSPYTTILLSFSPLMGPEASRTKVQSYARGTYALYGQLSSHQAAHPQ